MPRTLNFSECYRVLETNPKTFKRWLEEAGIDAEKQVNIADPRQKYLTLEQVQLLALRHGRTVAVGDEEEKIVAPVTLETLAEQLASMHELLTEVVQMVQQPRPMEQEPVDYQPRFDRIDQALEQMKALVQETQQKDMSSSQDEQDALTSTEQPVQAVVPTPKGVPLPTASASPSLPATPKSTSHSASQRAKAPSTTKQGAKKKRTSKAKPLPRTLVPLRVFAKQHEIDMKIADRASEGGNITVANGNWLYESRVVAKALDAVGQRTFYDYFSAKDGFTRCEQCPHGVQGQDHQAEVEAMGVSG